MNQIYISALFGLSLLLCITDHSIAQSIVINELMSSNSKFTDEDNDTPDWIELYNPTNDTLNIAGWNLSDRADSLMKWQLPSINMKPQQSLLVFASGKDRKNISAFETIINWGDEWQYVPGSIDIPDSWKTLSYDASAWQVGPSGFGFEDNDDATITDKNDISIFVRKTFQIDNINDIEAIMLHVDYDDGFVAYLNGTEVARENIANDGSEVNWDTPAENFREPNIIQGIAPEGFPIGNFKDLVVNGENILAIQVHNTSTSSSDLSLIPFLSLGYPQGTVITNAPPEILNLKGGMLHTNFKISAGGEAVFLSDPNLTIVDQIDSIPLEENISYGRKPDGTGSFYYFTESTPDSSNTTKAYTGKGDAQINFSTSPGIFSQSIELSLTADKSGDIYYTTDGSIPDTTSNKYSSTINISKTTVIKAALFSDNLLPSTPNIGSYIVEKRDIELPVISITTEPHNFFDENTGILVSGPNAESEFPYFGSNFWNDWERPIYFEYFNEQGELAYKSNAGTKVFGGWSRGMDQKSLAIFARSEYGNNSFDYPFFKTKPMDSYKSFVLRNAGNDFEGTGFRDALATSLVSNRDLDMQAYQPVVLYINGEYWGIINMREKVNEDYLENNHPSIDSDKVDILQGNGDAVEGSNTEYRQLISFINNNNSSDSSNYEKIGEQMDIDNFIEYQVAQIYYDNRDWPGNNIKYWKTQEEHGKWRWIMYDTDFGFNRFEKDGHEFNTLEFALDPNGTGWPNPAWSTNMLRKLIENESFKTDFINRFADRLNREFEEEIVMHAIDSFITRIEHEIPYHHDRWQNGWGWKYQIELTQEFAEKRPDYLREHIENEFDLSGQYRLSVENETPDKGYVQVNSLMLNDDNWQGYYFKNIPIKITAHAKPGYRFKEWVGSEDNAAYQENSFQQDTTLIPVFEAYQSPYGNIVINELNYNSNENTKAGDWIELYNTSPYEVNLSGWKVMDTEAINAYTIPSGTIIASQDYLVLAKNLSDFKAVHPDVENLKGEFAFGLSSSFDVVKLYDGNNTLIDSIYYESENPWPLGPNGEGSTLSLYNAKKDNAPYYNWYASVVQNGTPGQQNNLATHVEQVTFDQNNIKLYAYPNPFSEQTLLNFTLNKASHVRIDILDYKGALISTIENQMLNDGSYDRVWNANQEIPNGLYFARIVVNHSQNYTVKLILNR